MSVELDLNANLPALSAQVRAATEQLKALAKGAPELDHAITAVHVRIAQRAEELARATAEADDHSQRVARLRVKLGELDERLASFRGRLAALSGLVVQG
jgi:chromosome segregation ATPase